MNFFVDAYDYILTLLYTVIGSVLFFDCVFYTLLILFFIKKMGGKKFLFWKLRSLNPPSEKDKGRFRNKKFRAFSDVASITLLIFFTIKFPIYLDSYGSNIRDYVYKHTDRDYFIERDRKLLETGVNGLTLMPYVWMPVVIGVNKFRQWVGAETRVTWKYHDNRRECYRSNYSAHYCQNAMIMARALHRDDESLNIGRKLVKAKKKEGGYGHCSALDDLQNHAEQTRDIDLYKEMVKRRCELDCRRSCVDHKWAKKLPDHRLKNKFRDRRSLSSFLR